VITSLKRKDTSTDRFSPLIIYEDFASSSGGRFIFWRIAEI